MVSRSLFMVVMQYLAASVATVLLILLLIAGLIEVSTALPTATLPTVLSGFATYGGLFLAVVVMGGVTTAVVTFVRDGKR